MEPWVVGPSRRYRGLKVTGGADLTQGQAVRAGGAGEGVGPGGPLRTTRKS